MGCIIDDTPRTNKVLNIVLPIKFPIAILGFPFFIAAIDVNTSGNDVPIAIINIAINVCDIFNPYAIFSAEDTTTSPPYIYHY